MRGLANLLMMYFLLCTIGASGRRQLSGKPRILIDPSAVLFPKETVNMKGGEGLLNLIIKIAENPKAWKQIHRILETLEANNVAYSKRISKNNQHVLVDSHQNADVRLGDKRNDVPEKASDAAHSSQEETYKRWKNFLFAQKNLHPQLKAIGEEKLNYLPITNISGDWVHQVEGLVNLTKYETPKTKNEQSFEQRLKEIENELKKLSKLDRWSPSGLKRFNSNSTLPAAQTKNLSGQASEKSSLSNETKPIRTSKRFIYHRVSGEDTKLQGTSIWKKIASSQNNYRNVNGKRNFVAVSILSPLPESSKTAGQPKNYTKSASVVSGDSKLYRKKSPKLRKFAQKKLGSFS